MLDSSLVIAAVLGFIAGSVLTMVLFRILLMPALATYSYALPTNMAQGKRGVKWGKR